jgi:NADH-quinone oxidoreductase subunit H
MASFVLALIAWAVIPFNDGWVLSDINVAILYVFADLQRWRSTA